MSDEIKQENEDIQETAKPAKQEPVSKIANSNKDLEKRVKQIEVSNSENSEFINKLKNALAFEEQKNVKKDEVKFNNIFEEALEDFFKP